MATIPTVTQRLNAAGIERALDAMGLHAEARKISSARFFDGFSHSYTDEAVAWGRALIVSLPMVATDVAAALAAAGEPPADVYR